VTCKTRRRDPASEDALTGRIALIGLIVVVALLVAGLLLVF
jgi:hypothetical protein